jgi:topoisomerase IA-like protein
VCGDKKNATFCDLDCTIDELTNEHAIELIKNKMKYPKLIGKHNDIEIMLKKGINNFYISYDKYNISCDDENVTLDECIELIKQKVINVFKHDKLTYSILIGKFGPYINVMNKTKQIKNVPIKKIDPTTLDIDAILKLADDTNKKHNRESKNRRKNNNL